MLYYFLHMKDFQIILVFRLLERLFLDFLLFFDIAGFEPHFPLFPIPLPSPLDFPLDIEPRVSVPLFAPVETNLTFCSVFFLQYGQYLFSFFGIFILKPTVLYPSSNFYLLPLREVYMKI